MKNNVVFVVRKVNYSHGRRGHILKEKSCKKLYKAEIVFCEFSLPEIYGSTLAPYLPCELKENIPLGLIKSVLCQRSMTIVELCERS